MRLTILLLFLSTTLLAQRNFYQNEAYPFSRADTLRGQLRPERTGFDVHFYELDIAVDPSTKMIRGFVDVHYRVEEPTEQLQLDLYENMTIDRIEMAGKELPFRREFNAVFIEVPSAEKNSLHTLRVVYHGQPVTARRAPWDGGFVWSSDSEGTPWVGVACEGDGASLWWPNKDHLSDEPDSMAIRIAVPKDLMCVANGNLRDTRRMGDLTRYDWFVTYPIDNYNVTVNIGDYVHFGETYINAEGQPLELDYYVLRENEAVAREHFKQVPGVLECFEEKFGPYPFYEDGFALVETPYLGMEHQGAIAYGNKYLRGYLGGMIPEDMDWDYIIVHETGHEWFGNSISVPDMSEMWVQESFTTYSEAVYVECHYGYERAVEYLNSQLPMVRNQEPILGPMQVNFDDWRSSDHYYKGAWVIHTFRHALGDDELFWDILKNFHEEHKRSIVGTQDWIDYVNRRTEHDWSSFFEQYLWHPNLPKLLYRVEEILNEENKMPTLKVRLRFNADVRNFEIPLIVGTPGNYQRVEVSNMKTATIELPGMTAGEFRVATELFLVDAELVE